MANLRHIHQYMRERRRVLLEDGRTGNIVRVDTTYPLRSTTVSVWTDTAKGPGLAKVDIQSVVGPVPEAELPDSERTRERKQAAG
jgi:hypothetical protein